MTYQQYSVHIKVCHYLGKEPAGQYKRIYDFLTELWDGMVIVVYSRYNRVVLLKKCEWVFEQDLETGYLWCRGSSVWSFFQDDVVMEDTEIQDFIISAVEEHLKCQVGTPQFGHEVYTDWVEEHLKCQVGTPSTEKTEDELL